MAQAGNYTGVQRPTNKIVASGTPLVQELRVQTATNMYPGRLVIAGTTTDEIIVNTGATTNAYGFIGYEQTNPNFRPSTIDTIQVIGDQVAVLNGGGFTILAGYSGGAVAKGDELTGAADGKVTVRSRADVSTNQLIGYAEDASANDKILVRSVI